MKLLSAYLLLLCAFGPVAHAGTAVWTGATLNLTTGDYSMAFIKVPAFTFQSVTFKGFDLIKPTGANQCVLSIKARNPGEKTTWIGTLHGGEIVQSVTLEVDGKTLPKAELAKPVSGEIFVLTKHSKMGPLDYTSVIRLSPSGLEETNDFRVREASTEMNFLYAFMHCWTLDLTDWFAKTRDGVVEDKFYSDGKFYLKEDISQLALYSSSHGIGAIMAYDECYQGENRYHNMLYNRDARDNKHYFRVTPPTTVGEDRHYHCKIVGFSAPPDGWKAAAEALLAKVGAPTAAAN